MKPSSDACEQEQTLHPLVEVANAQLWHPALAALRVNHALLNFADTERLVIAYAPEAPPPFDVLDALESRSTSGLNRVFNGFISDLALSLARHVDLSAVKQADAAAQVFSAFNAANNDSTLKDLIARQVISFSEHALGALASTAFEWIRKKAAEQRRAIGDDFDEMCSQLVRLGLLRPWIQVGACVNCLSQEFTISPVQVRGETCARCGHAWYPVTLYLLSEGFESAKRHDRDLPLFIAGFLRGTTPDRGKIFPCATIAGNQEIDVLVRAATTIGIECKNYWDMFVAPPERISNTVGELHTQAKAYKRAGIERFIAVVNYEPEVAHIVATKLRDRMAGEMPCDVVSSWPEALVPKLQEIASELRAHVEFEIDRHAQAIARSQALQASPPAAAASTVQSTNSHATEATIKSEPAPIPTVAEGTRPVATPDETGS